MGVLGVQALLLLLLLNAVGAQNNGTGRARRVVEVGGRQPRPLTLLLCFQCAQ